MESKYLDINTVLFEKHSKQYLKLLKRECENLFGQNCEDMRNDIKCAACPLKAVKKK